MGYEKPMTGAERVAKRRAALRAQGLRPKTIWVPDTRTTEFKEQAKQACARLWELSSHPEEKELVDFAQAMTNAALADLPPPWTEEE